MSILAANFSTNRIGGFGNQLIHAESETAEHEIGEPMDLKDGRCFRYAKFGVATAAGLLVSQDVSATCLVETDNAIDGTQPAGSSLAIGSLSIMMDNAAFAATTLDQYAGGYLHTTDDAGEGYTYRIGGNTAFTNTDEVTFTLLEPLVIAVTTATDIAITGNLYGGVIAAVAATDTLISGVSMRVMQANYYGWVQTKGVATVLSDVALTLGDQLTLSDGVAGACQLQDAYTEQTIGYALFTPDSTGHVGVMLNIS
jgi:hypothetical protein